MKFTGDKLVTVLMQQWETITLVSPDGREYRSISPRWAAEQIAGASFVGYGKNGVVFKVVSHEAPRRGPFATNYDLKVVMSDYPRLPHVEKNPQSPGGLKWVPQPKFATGGRPGAITTIHIGGAV